MIVPMLALPPRQLGHDLCNSLFLRQTLTAFAPGAASVLLVGIDSTRATTAMAVLHGYGCRCLPRLRHLEKKVLYRIRCIGVLFLRAGSEEAGCTEDAVAGATHVYCRVREASGRC
jgi:hypothetical protein